MEDVSELKVIADESLQAFEAVELKAKLELDKQVEVSAESFANAQTFNSATAINNLSKSKAINRKSYQHLVNEPAISRVRVRDEHGVEDTFYFCRTAPVSLDKNIKLVSYRNPMIGKLAAAYVGDEIVVNLPSGTKEYEVTEKVSFTPINKEQLWDSANTVYENEPGLPKTIISLRELIESGAVGEHDDILSQLLAEEESSSLVVEGIRRDVLTSMSLRDRPILDKFQDEIFRLPLDQQLLIVGPPGTGKTTTLIRRLGQKLDHDALDEREQHFVKASFEKHRVVHESSWLMFTPTDLLKQYVKEAFNKEEIAASSDKIQTWVTYRNHLARNVLGILKSASSNGKFIVKSNMSVLSNDVITSPQIWFDNFNNFHQERMMSFVQNGIDVVAKLDNENTLTLSAELLDIVKRKLPLLRLYESLDKLESKISPILKELKSSSDNEIKKTLNLQLNINRDFLKEFAQFLDDLSEELAEGEEDLDDIFDEDEVEAVATTSVSKALREYNRFLRVLARSSYQNRKFAKGSKNESILEWFSGKLPNKDKLVEIGKNITAQNGLRRLLNLAKRFVIEVPASYRNFRKQNIGNETWYTGLPEKPNHLHAFELDAIILLMLKNTRLLLKERFVENKLEQSKYDVLQLISEQFKNQILVDEATDFSCVQLSCMYNLTQPYMISFFACGDFNQRITENGARSEAQIEWISKSIQVKSVNTVYRQSKVLNDFAHQLLEQMDGASITAAAVPEYISHEGFSPALAKSCSDCESKASWLTNRIQEVESSVGKLPTIAILVNREEEIQPLTTSLNEYLQELSLLAVACHDGKAIGEDSDIRIFSIEHIKGLEFEAVFFIDIDKLAELQPTLFDKYLYVGATRAATYLGMTVESELPSKLLPLEYMYCEGWG